MQKKKKKNIPLDPAGGLACQVRSAWLLCESRGLSETPGIWLEGSRKAGGWRKDDDRERIRPSFCFWQGWELRVEAGHVSFRGTPSPTHLPAFCPQIPSRLRFCSHGLEVLKLDSFLGLLPSSSPYSVLEIRSLETVDFVRRGHSHNCGPVRDWQRADTPFCVSLFYLFYSYLPTGL